MPRGIPNKPKAPDNIRTAVIYLKQGMRTIAEKPMADLSQAEICLVMAYKALTEKP